MSTRSQSHQEAAKGKRQQRTASSNYRPNNEPNIQEALRKLQDTLRRGMAVESILWSFRTMDWVADIHASDIDDDGDIEIIVGSRDGYIHVLTRWGAVKWERLLEGHCISAVCVLPPSEITIESSVRIIVGTRAGKVLALDKSGEKLKDWEYDTGRMIRQLYVSARTPENVVIGSEDDVFMCLIVPQESLAGTSTAPTVGFVVSAQPISTEMAKTKFLAVRAINTSTSSITRAIT